MLNKNCNVMYISHFGEPIVDVIKSVSYCGLNEYLIVMNGCLVVEIIALKVGAFGVRWLS